MRNTSVFSNFSQRDYRYSTNTKFTVRRTNTYTHTYIHTDTACVQHVNVGLAQARPNKIIACIERATMLRANITHVTREYIKQMKACLAIHD